MSSTAAECLNRGYEVISDQKATYTRGRVLPFNRLIKAYSGYLCEIRHTQSPQQRACLQETADKAKSALREFLGSKKPLPRL